MSPTVLRYKKYRFYFNSREESRKHIHVDTSEGKSKFWLEPIVSLAMYRNISTQELKEIEEIIKKHEEEFINEWSNHFTQ